MYTFRGWIPTITGKLSFSLIGTDNSHKKNIINHLVRENKMLAILKRVSTDGPLPPKLQFLLGRNPTQTFVIEAETDFSPMMSGAVDSNKLPIWVQDDKGILKGRVFVYYNPLLLRKSKDWELPGWSKLKEIKKDVRSTGSFQHRELNFIEKVKAKDGVIEEPLNASADNEATNVFEFEINRNGQCTIKSQSTGSRVPGGLTRQVFFCLRDLIHKHYHHNKHSHELVGVCYNLFPNDKYDDLTWRRETLYALTRMALDMRRQGKTKYSKNALGVLAYAKAFQEHFMSWTFESYIKEKGDDPSVVKNEAFSSYDFDAFKL